MRASSLLCIALLSCTIGCKAASAVSLVEPQEAQPLAEMYLVDGRVEAKNATEIRAPQNTFRLAGWTSNSSWIKLLEFAEDGVEVKKGDQIARFEFWGNKALPRITERIARAKANSERSKLDQEATQRQLEMDREQRDLNVSRSALDLKRAGVIAQRTLAGYELDHELAKFEADAIRQRVAAHDKSMRAEQNYHDLEIKRAETVMSRYKIYEDRFSLEAPHDGVVRHAYNARRQRKIEKGDGMPSGTHILSVALDEELIVRVYVPEKYIGRLGLGTEVTVLGLNDEELIAKVTHIDPVPQEMGFLKENEEVPNAREKAYAVLAEFATEQVSISAGNEIKVQLP